MSQEVLQWLNVLLLPMAGLLVRQGERIARLEAHVSTLIERRKEVRP